MTHPSNLLLGLEGVARRLLLGALSFLSQSAQARLFFPLVLALLAFLALVGLQVLVGGGLISGGSSSQGRESQQAACGAQTRSWMRPVRLVCVKRPLAASRARSLAFTMKDRKGVVRKKISGDVAKQSPLPHTIMSSRMLGRMSFSMVLERRRSWREEIWDELETCGGSGD